MMIVNVFVILIYVFAVETCPSHKIEIHNNCPFEIWPAVLSKSNPETNLGFKLYPNERYSLNVPCKWSARIWPRTDCDKFGRKCSAGDCGDMTCLRNGDPDATLAEFTLDGGQARNFKNDVYSISSVEGFNLPTNIIPINGLETGDDPTYDCVMTQCSYDFRNYCDEQLRVVKLGKPVSCLSACTKFDNDSVCCRNAYGTPEKCNAKNNPLVQFFKKQCPDMYTYAFDDEAALFSCQGHTGADYVVTFCG